MKFVTIVGTRPQFVKAAVLSRVLCRLEGVEEKIIHTGQHFDANMSDIFFEEMQIPKPEINLQVHGLSQGAMTGQMMEKIEQVLMCEKPDKVIVYGDTNSTLAAAISAKKLHIPLAHVEAGLRSYNMDMPEEVNRIIVDRISDYLFCPTSLALENLKKEGMTDGHSEVILSGDVMQDAVMFYKNFARKPEKCRFSFGFVLCTVHRAENVDNAEKLSSVLKALETIARKHEVLFPLHPRTRAKLEMEAYDFKNSGICFIEPLGYLEMLWVLQNSSVILTDSGGLQKEAYFLRKPCITLREETEWMELVDEGYNFIVGTDFKKICDCYDFVTKKSIIFRRFDLYGNGKAGEKIVSELLK